MQLIRGPTIHHLPDSTLNKNLQVSAQSLVTLQRGRKGGVWTDTKLVWCRDAFSEIKSNLTPKQPDLKRGVQERSTLLDYCCLPLTITGESLANDAVIIEDEEECRRRTPRRGVGEE